MSTLRPDANQSRLIKVRIYSFIHSTSSVSKRAPPTLSSERGSVKFAGFCVSPWARPLMGRDGEDYGAAGSRALQFVLM